MGFIVLGYCHASAADAFLHLRDDPRGLIGTGAYGSTALQHVWHYPSAINSGGLVLWTTHVRGSTGTDTYETWVTYQLPSCDAEFHDSPMPWGVVSSQSETSELWNGMYSLELAASLIAASWAVWGLAFLARTSFRIFR